MGLGEGLGDKEAFFSEFLGVGEDLPRGGSEKTGVAWLDAGGRGVLKTSCDGGEIGGLFLEDLEIRDGFSGEGIPEKDLFAVVWRGGVLESAESEAGGGELFYRDLHLRDIITQK